ncbi:C45 family autoproteolytic acyltransferase/hydrolase [Paracoccus sp. EGI L200073]|nr:C45 family autoproteolytic acyltransferase/hydrolase [Paracoccus salsus]
MTLTFDAVDEAMPGPAWKRRWDRSWPAYEAWFIARGGDGGPSRAACRAALRDHMPELLPVHDRLVVLAGGSDRAARFLSTWNPPPYLGGCSLAAMSDGRDVRLVRNYDLSPDLNEGLLLRSAWTGRPVMGMIEFLWGLSDGINEAGLSVALAYGGRSQTAPGFGITTLLRYVLEVCDDVAQAVEVLSRVPSHMAYNVVLADAGGRTASLELQPGGGAVVMPVAIATNHQIGPHPEDRPEFTRTHQRFRHLSELPAAPGGLLDAFLRPPLWQDRHAEGFGTLFTACYDPVSRSMCLAWPDQRWDQSLSDFTEGQRVIGYGRARAAEHVRASPPAPLPDWTDWVAVTRHYAGAYLRVRTGCVPHG